MMWSSPTSTPSPVPIPIPLTLRLGLRLTTPPNAVVFGIWVPSHPTGPFKLRPSFSNSIRDSSSSDGSSNFAKRVEQAWLISQQPRPIACSSCSSNGHIECKWCAGTGFFIIGDNMLCEVPSRNTTCVICAGEGSIRCTDCQGTGFRAKWLGKPLISKE